MSPRSWRSTASRGTTATRGDDDVCGAAAQRVEVRPLPQLEHEQAPEPVRVVGAAVDVVLEQALHRARPQLPAAARAGVEQHVAGELPQPVAEPVRERHAEAGLAALGHLLGKVVGERSPQRLLAAPAFRLQLAGQRHAELEHLPVEERRPQLERVRHRRDVGLQQEIAGQIRLDVEELEAGDAVGRRRAEELPGGGGARNEVGVEQLDASLGGKDLHQPAVALPGLRGGCLEQAGGANGRRPALSAHGAQGARRRADAGNVQPAGELVCDVALVAGERLVASVPRERDGDVLPRRLAHEKERQRRVVSERLVERLRETRQCVGHVAFELDLLVLRRVALGDGARVAALVVALVAEARW